MMDNVKRTYRDAETAIKKAARGVGGTDLKDSIGNAGDEAAKGLGNLGDEIRQPKVKPDAPTVVRPVGPRSHG